MPDGTQSAQTVASFETCLDELEKVVRELESGDLPLDRSLELFSRGMQLSDPAANNWKKPKRASRC